MTEIAIIGPIGAGKTTYLAALAHLSSEANIFPDLDIRILGDENSQTLQKSGFNLIKSKEIVGQTELGNEPAYGFTITIPAGKYGVKKPQKIKLSFVDYAGEIFEKIARSPDEVKSYINQLMKVEVWMVMLTDFQPGKADHEYKMIMENLWNKINSTKIRMAVVMNKCERGEIWPGRLDPDQDLFKVRLPKTYNYLTDPNNKISGERLRFFACSSFGVRGFQDPRPNRETFYKDLPSEFAAVIRDDCPWKPYGLISPLYWLSKGKILSDSRI